MGRVREAIKKGGLLMEIFHKGSDPPPPYFRELWNGCYTFDFGNKKGKKQNLPKTLEMAIFKRSFL